MIWEKSNFIAQSDVWMAYRKAKADLYYERGHPNAFALCEYEENLEGNLANLYTRLTGNSLDWMTEETFVGTWSVATKGLDSQGDTEKSFWMPSDPDKAWAARCQAIRLKNPKAKPEAEFRLIGVHPIAFHVVSTLWMHKAGHLYDAVLGPEACGSRLRRKHSGPSEPLREPNPLSLGTFEPYLHKFSRWRDDGLTAMRNALEQGKRVVAITADVKQFYHHTSPDFLLHPDYLKAVGLPQEFSVDQKRFTKAIITAIHAWAERTPLHKMDSAVGLPVGLPAARLIANVALAELDKTIKRELAPLYYGRYVDDILLVLEDTRDFVDAKEVWKWIIRRSNGILKSAKDEKTSVLMQAKYLGGSVIEFTGSKQKVFLLEADASHNS